MDFNGLHELYQVAMRYLSEHESGALGLGESLTSPIAMARAEYLMTQGIVALPIKLEAYAPENFIRFTVLIARNQVALQTFLGDLRSRAANGSATVTVLIN